MGEVGRTTCHLLRGARFVVMTWSGRVGRVSSQSRRLRPRRSTSILPTFPERSVWDLVPCPDDGSLIPLLLLKTSGWGVGDRDSKVVVAARSEGNSCSLHVVGVGGLFRPSSLPPLLPSDSSYRLPALYGVGDIWEKYRGMNRPLGGETVMS